MKAGELVWGHICGVGVGGVQAFLSFVCVTAWI